MKDKLLQFFDIRTHFKILKTLLGIFLTVSILYGIFALMVSNPLVSVCLILFGLYVAGWNAAQPKDHGQGWLP